MASTVTGCRDSTMAAYNLDVQAGIRNSVPDDFECTSHSENRHGGAERNYPHLAESCGYANHVLLGDAYVYVSFREGFLECNGTCGLCKVGIQCVDIGMLFCKFYQTFIETKSSSFLICHNPLPAPCMPQRFRLLKEWLHATSLHSP